MAYEQLHGRDLRSDYNLGSKAGGVDAIWIMNGMYPAEQPSCFFNSHVDTTTAHGRAKVVVPVRAMEGIASFMKKAGPWNTREFIIIRCGKQIAVPHMLGGVFG